MIPIGQQKVPKNPFKHGDAKGKSVYPFVRRDALGNATKPVKPSLISKTKLIPIPRDPEAIRQLADELNAWAHLPDALMIEQFPIAKRYSLKRFFNLADVDEYFADVLTNAINHIGIRRDMLATDKNSGQDGNVIMKTFPIYNDRWHNYEQSTKSSPISGKGTTPINVISAPIPSDSRVPEIKRDHDVE